MEDNVTVSETVDHDQYPPAQETHQEQSTSETHPEETPVFSQEQSSSDPADTAAPPPMMMFNPGDQQQPAFFNPTSLPSIPEVAAPGPGSRKGSLTRQGSVPSRRGSEARSRQASESKDPLPPMMMPPTSLYPSIPPPMSSSSTPPVMSSTAPPSMPPAPSMMTPAPPPSTPAAPAADQKPAEKDVSDKKKSKKKESQDGGGKKSSWFGGIFPKIFKNQVHLPDDNDKRIVYDEDKKRWVNLDEDEDSQGPAAPPPMDPAFSQPSTGAGGPGGGPGGAGGPPAAPTNFRAGLAGRRGGRGYVDVLGQSGMSKPSSAPAMVPNGAPPPSSAAPPMMFSPLPPAPGQDDTAPASDTSDVNSGPASMPMMFNPNSMTNSSLPPAF